MYGHRQDRILEPSSTMLTPSSLAPDASRHYEAPALLLAVPVPAFITGNHLYKASTRSAQLAPNK